MSDQACVYLVGTGPGDPELLTVKALSLIKRADVIVYDRLVGDAILQQIPTGVAQIYVGKRSGKHTFTQHEINDLLVKLARHNRCVVRLKGGDPFVFGRGSEEALYLVSHHVDFEVIPGVTAASACTTYAGIPLTHRGLANQVQIITGHCREDSPLEYDWPGLVNSSATLVIYMGVAQIAKITQSLMEAGMDPAMPAAAIENGTSNSQRVWTTCVAQLARDVEIEGLKAPVMFVIGQVVTLANDLAWCNQSTSPQGRVRYEQSSHG